MRSSSKALMPKGCPARAFAWLGARLVACALTAAIPGTIENCSAMDIKVIEGGDKDVTTLALSGRVDAGDGLKVRGFIDALPPAKPVVAQLGIAGGMRLEAMSIGRLFYQARIRTVIAGKETRCISPCPLTLVGGRDPVTGKPAYVKHSTAMLGFSGVTMNYPEKDYTAKNLDAAVANTQRDILQIADYLRAVEANVDMLKYYLSVPTSNNEIKFISNDEALDLGITVLVEETGQVIQPLRSRRN